MAAKKNKKTFEINIDQTYSQTYIVKASSKAEAKKIAWARFKPQRKSFKLWCDLRYS